LWFEAISACAQVSQVFTEDKIQALKGTTAIGHTRYSTAGGSVSTNAQPFVLQTDLGQVAVAHNGQLTRQESLRKEMLQRGVGLFTHTDSEIIAQCMARPVVDASPSHPFLQYYFPPGAGASGLSPAARSSPAISLGEQSPATEQANGVVSIPSQGGAGAPANSPAAASTTEQLEHEPGTPAPAVRVDTPRGVEDYSVRVPAPGRGGAVLPEGATSENSIEFRLASLVAKSEGAFAFVVLTHNALYGVRDRLGLRPLCIGACVEDEIEGGAQEVEGRVLAVPDSLSSAGQACDSRVSYCLSSESCALGTVGYTLVREVHPGEIVRITPEGVTSWWAMPKLQPSVPPALCVFEYVYFARPDSVLEGQLVHTVRQRLGAQLAAESPVPHADIVSGVPDSSIAAGIGFALASNKPFSEVLCKNRYVGRTFIQPDQMMRENSIKMKFNPLSQNIVGKVVVLVDDSIVRGSTMRKMVPLLRKAGAKEIHIRISSPPLRHPCYMGVDIGSYEELIAHRKQSVPAIAAHLGADSLAFLSHDGMMHAVSQGAVPASRPTYMYTPAGEAEATPSICSTPQVRCGPSLDGLEAQASPQPPLVQVQVQGAGDVSAGTTTSSTAAASTTGNGEPHSTRTVKGFQVAGDPWEERGLVGYSNKQAEAKADAALAAAAGGTRGAPAAAHVQDIAAGATATPPRYVRSTLQGHCTACFNGVYPLPLDKAW